MQRELGINYRIIYNSYLIPFHLRSEMIKFPVHMIFLIFFTESELKLIYLWYGEKSWPKFRARRGQAHY